MSIAIGGNTASKIYLGSDEVERMYMGSNLVYGSAPVPLPYDAKIEYLQQGDGYSYIDTGYTPNEITPIIETRIYLPTASSNAYPVGSDGSGDTRFSIGRLTANRIELRIGNYSSVGSQAANWYVIKLDGSNGKAYINGTLKWTSSKLNFNDMTIALFSSHAISSSTGLPIIRGASSGAMLKGVRISYFKLWNGATLLQDMIPVRVGQVGYMYDKVSGNLFGNAAQSGAFVLGADI